MSKATRITLDPEQSEILTDHGADVFLVVHRPHRTEDPSINRRWTITLQPVTKGIADLAVGVALGSHRAVKIKLSATSSPCLKP